MRNLRLATFLLIMLSSAANSYADVNFEEITLEQAIQKAKRIGKSIMIDFYTDWCVPCKELDKHIFQDTMISRFINDRFISLKINAEKEDGIELRKKYQVPESYPTVLFLDSEGMEIDRIIGLFGKNDYFKTIQDYALGKNTFPVLLLQSKKDTNNPALTLKIGKKYAERTSWEQASQYYEKALSYEEYKNDASIWWRLGMVYHKLGQIQKAEKATRKAVELKPDNPYLKDFLEKIRTQLK